jgi:hypothetical protein
MHELVRQHLVREFVQSFSSSSSTRSFGLLDTVRDLDHEVRFRKLGILSLDFRHGFVGRSLDSLLVNILDVVVERTSAFVRITEMLVVIHVLRANIAA